ncbi:MAG: multidrug effflux MFS transporter [Notoacmeibacter sp.]|nr:multidrug effflux MFS transporter [Notoacmeibacter sp.]
MSEPDSAPATAAVPDTIAPAMSERMVSFLGALFVVIGPMSMALYTPAMPAIVDAFATTEAAVKMTLALYFAGFAFAQLLAGPMSDSLGRKPVLAAFMVIYCVASIFALYTPSVEALILARFAQGIGASAGVAISRAIVRDLFNHDQSSRIMNMIGIILAAGPAVAPTIGGLTMEIAGWRAIFGVMALLGLTVMGAALFVLRETAPVERVPLRLSTLGRSYLTLLAHTHFMLTSMIMACTVGALYAQATFLPFILMSRVGLTPSQFGFSMIAQSGTFFLGALLVRSLMRRTSAARLVAPGLLLIGVGSALQTLLNFWEPSLLRVMGPVAVYACGIAFVMPAMTTACLAPHGKIAGAASALMGFMQMGLGLLMGAAGALMGDPVRAMGTLIPLMGASSILCWLAYRVKYGAADVPQPDGRIIASIPPGRTLGGS